MSLFDELGGEAALRAIIDRFVDRVFEDTMIGFFFARADRARIKQKEYEHAAAHLGSGVKYSGRPIGAVHAAHPIQGGHFMRRLQILRETLEELEAPETVRQHWIEHTLSLRAQVTGDVGSECDGEAVQRRIDQAKRAGR
jgi:hemoglobin